MRRLYTADVMVRGTLSLVLVVVSAPLLAYLAGRVAKDAWKHL
jgi:hypothetical protein